MFYTVYKITNLLNHKIYIGAHKTSNLDDGYMGSGHLIRAAIKKYGLMNFKKEYLAILDSSEAMFQLESELVTEDSLGPHSYNMVCGGKGFNEYHAVKAGKRSGELYPRKIADLTKKQREEDPEGWRARQDKAIAASRAVTLGRIGTFTGKTHSDETRKRIGQTNSEKQKGPGNSQFGTCWVNKDGQAKKIKREEISQYREAGYKQGRK